MISTKSIQKKPTVQKKHSTVTFKRPRLDSHWNVSWYTPPALRNPWEQTLSSLVSKLRSPPSTSWRDDPVTSAGPRQERFLSVRLHQKSCGNVKDSCAPSVAAKMIHGTPWPSWRHDWIKFSSCLLSCCAVVGCKKSRRNIIKIIAWKLL